jgi:hypothetical protein
MKMNIHRACVRKYVCMDAHVIESNSKYEEHLTRSSESVQVLLVVDCELFEDTFPAFF